MTETPPFVDLEAGEMALDDPEELYWRQCPPAFVENDGVPSVQMFDESTGDEGKLSGARSNKASAELAYEERLAQDKPTSGTWGVTVQEIANAGSRAVDDEALHSDAPTGHTYIDYRHLASENRPTRRAVRQSLHRAAISRGRQWPSASTDPDGPES